MKHFPNSARPPCIGDLAGLEHARAPRARRGLAFVAGLVVGATLAVFAILLFATPLA